MMIVKRTRRIWFLIMLSILGTGLLVFAVVSRYSWVYPWVYILSIGVFAWAVRLLLTTDWREGEYSPERRKSYE